MTSPPDDDSGTEVNSYEEQSQIPSEVVFDVEPEVESEDEKETSAFAQEM